MIVMQCVAHAPTRSDEAVVELNSTGIKSEYFTTHQKIFTWNEIQDYRIYWDEGDYLELQIAHRPAQRSSLSGAALNLPILALDMLSKEDQNKLIAGIKDSVHLPSN